MFVFSALGGYTEKQRPMYICPDEGKKKLWWERIYLKRKQKKKVWSQGLFTPVMGKGHGDKWEPGACCSASLVYLESYKAIRDPIWKEIEK